MSEKTYLGNGKTSKFGENYQLDLNKMFEALYNQTQNKKVIDALNFLKEVITNDLKGFGTFDRKDGKQVVFCNISTAKMQKENDRKETHYITLNEWKPEGEKENTKKSDNPF